MIDYIAHGLGLVFSLYQSGFYMISPSGWMPWLGAKFDLDIPGY
jgi:hypothetical protein